MRKYKWLAGISIITAATIVVSCKTHFETTKATVTVMPSAQAFNRGKILVTNICGGCHYDKSVGKFIGSPIHEVPAFMGRVYSANLTNSKSNGIPPHYSDAGLKYLLKTGIAKDGRFIPYMLRPNMAEEDLDAIIVYLRSGDGPVAAADTTIGKTHLNNLGKLVMHFTGKPMAYIPDVKRPPETDEINNGRYLVDNIGCYHCHSASLTSLNYLHPEQTKNFMAGGIMFKTPQGFKIYASNLTPDKTTGIGNYTITDFRKALKDGQAPTRTLHPPMPQFHQLPDKEVDAIYVYLQTLPAKNHLVKGQ